MVGSMKDSSFLWARIAAVSWAIAALPITGTSEASSIANSMVSPASADSSEPHLAQGADGTTVLSWLEHSAEGATLRYSVLTEGQWTAARTVAQGDKWFVNWADFPSVSPITSRLWAAHWLAKREGGTYAYDVVIALSQNAGETWGEPFTPHSDNTATEHGFVSLFPWQQGIGALWLDGRNMDEDGSGHSHGSESEAPKEETGMTLRAALIAPDQGAVTEYLVDGLVCDCCQTDVAIGPQGPIAVYRNRTSDEIRDIYVSRVVIINGSKAGALPMITGKLPVARSTALQLQHRETMSWSPGLPWRMIPPVCALRVHLIRASHFYQLSTLIQVM